ncbi:16S rRNA (cytosine(1402)-N(4))-methyltransferase RsmH [Methylocapsa sp. D3K7]|uniref:16S rRNA (cytosine(1402)-N(4))-methyltransferase RsmH n=1 Tax=Methylocapsa sp. D3K7 TaxID=3041435 RepID=UPI00244EA094|nr:16S rRNA (cytosine(1402)-N(4))-methyltransferase RsmH [Methylocapsa sp. D3K7]WGJ15616.1 16S rRNA (cytosine(1402)-N(4))-methyltransferase RsmH [Methylocapsa sp. D3K7]
MTAGRGDEEFLAAGGPARHIPVLRDEVMTVLAPREGGLYLDATFGAGGYSRALLSMPKLRVLALDRDPIAIAEGAMMAAETCGRLTLVKERFGRLDQAARELGFSDFDGVVLDIGLSSMQIDDARRGFSFRGDGPLDMRMDCAGTSAADLVNTAAEATLANIFYYFGEERASRRIARAIVMDRAKAPFTSTAALAGMIARVVPGKTGEIHPATRVFQALRIAINDELGELVHALAGAEAVLKEGGRLAVVTFHSLEDRIVKQFFAERSGRGRTASRRLPHEIAPPQPTFVLAGRQPVIPSQREIDANPRARSAKLRHGERTKAPPRGLDDRLMALAKLPVVHPGGH